MKKFTNIFLFLVLALISTDCNKKNELLRIGGRTMGTTYSVIIVPTDKEFTTEGLKSKIDEVLKEVNSEMSTFIGNSEISRFNALKSKNWFSVSEGFARVVKNSLKISKLSNGAFDITVAPLIDLWGFGKKPKTEIPSDEDLKRANEYIGYEKLKVDIESNRIKKENPDTRINLSSIAKGYGVDKVAELLNGEGFENYMVEIGGEVRVRGDKYGKKWRIGIITPDTVRDYNTVILLKDVSLATSGDYYNYFEKNGKRYSHTIDPLTMKPITHKLASVTIIHSSCMMADGYATAIDVLGPQRGYEFALKLNLPIYMIIRKGKGFYVKMTPSFEKILQGEK